MEIQSLRQLVRDGLYEVPSEQVAQAIIEWIDPLALTRGRAGKSEVTPRDHEPVQQELFGPPPRRP